MVMMIQTIYRWGTKAWWWRRTRFACVWYWYQRPWQQPRQRAWPYTCAWACARACGNHSCSIPIEFRKELVTSKTVPASGEKTWKIRNGLMSRIWFWKIIHRLVLGLFQIVFNLLLDTNRIGIKQTSLQHLKCLSNQNTYSKHCK